MQIAVLGSPRSWYLGDLRRAAQGRHVITSAAFGQLASQLDAKGFTASAGPCDLRQMDAVLVRSMPPGSLEQVVFRMDILNRLQDVGTMVVNPPRALEAAVDKYLASARLRAAGLLIPRTIACQTVADAVDAFATLGGDVVVKPLFGSEGRGIARVNDEAVAQRVFATLARLQSVLYLQEYVPHHGYDLRLLLIGERVLGMKRSNHADWRTNVARGAQAEPLTPSDEMIRMAQRAAEAVQAPLAGVDLLPGRDGRLYTLEVNAVPGWRALSAALQVDVATIVLEYLETVR